MMYAKSLAQSLTHGKESIVVADIIISITSSSPSRYSGVYIFKRFNENGQHAVNSPYLLPTGPEALAHVGLEQAAR